MDSSFEPQRYVYCIGTQESRVYGPVDQSYGMRDIVCRCLSWHHAENARLIAKLLNDESERDKRVKCV